MHSRTTAALRELEKVSWFLRVGINDGSSVITLSCWPEAIEQCSSFEWEDLRLEAANQYRECIARHSRERLQLWNDTVDDVKNIIVPLVDRKTAAAIREHALPEIFKIRVRNDIIGACMEAEYADVCPPGFFTSIAHWYVNGHFPCGWWGAFPQGKLVVY